MTSWVVVIVLVVVDLGAKLNSVPVRGGGVIVTVVPILVNEVAMLTVTVAVESVVATFVLVTVAVDSAKATEVDVMTVVVETGTAQLGGA